MFSRRNDLPESRDSTNDSQPTNCFPHSTMRPVLPPFPLFLLSSRHYTVFYSFYRKALCGFAVRSRLSILPLPSFLFLFSTVRLLTIVFSSLFIHPPSTRRRLLSFESSVSLAAFRIDRVIDTLDRTPPPRPVSRKGTK